MDLLTAIQSESLAKIQDIALMQGIHSDSTSLAYDALNRALECRRKDVAMWLIQCFMKNRVKYDNPSICGSTPLYNAVKLGHMDIIIMLLNNRASVVAVDSDNNSALHIAFLRRYDEITNLLLNHAVITSNFTNVQNNQGLSHLHIASTRNHVKAIKGFLKADAKEDSLSLWAGYSALHFAIEYQLLEAAKVLDVASKVENVKINNSSQNSYLNKCTFPHFHLACLKESASVLKEFIDRRANLNETIIWGEPHHYHYSPLQCAIESPYDRKEKVQLLLRHGAVVKQEKCHCTCKHMTALHLAFYKEYHMTNDDFDSTIVDSLYKVVDNKEENIMDENNLGYLHVAVSRNDFDMVEKYLAQGANINHSVLRNNCGFSGYTPLHFALKYELMYMAKCLIARGAYVCVDVDNDYQTPLLEVVQTGNLEIMKLLKQSGFDIQNLLLHYAVTAGNPVVVQYLIDSGCDVNAKDDLGQTPIILSLKADPPCKNIIEILLEAGACMSFTDQFGKSALRIVDNSAFLSGDVKKFEIYKLFLEKISKVPAGRIVIFNNFHLLVDGNGKDIEMLLRTNIDLFITDYTTCTLVHALVQNRNPGVIEQLRARKFDINARNCWDCTPLMNAVHCGNVGAVQLLLELGADIEAADDFGETALFYSFLALIGTEECAQVLLERGANAQITNTITRTTLFDLVLESGKYSQGELILAQLALREWSGTIITELIQRKIDSHGQFKSYFEYCKQLLSVEIYPSITVFDVLMASQRKLERYLKNEELALKLKELHTVEYYDVMLTKRLSKASRMIELKKAAAPIISMILNTDYNRIPSIVDDILNHFVQEEIEYIVSIESELQLDSCFSVDA